MSITAKKTASYCIMHLLVAFIVAYGVSGDLRIAMGISIIEPAVQTVAFFFHEKIWARIAATRTA